MNQERGPKRFEDLSVVLSSTRTRGRVNLQRGWVGKNNMTTVVNECADETVEGRGLILEET